MGKCSVIEPSYPNSAKVAKIKKGSTGITTFFTMASKMRLISSRSLSMVYALVNNVANHKNIHIIRAFITGILWSSYRAIATS